MQIYINKNGQQLGAFDEEKVFEMLRNGQLLPTDYGIKEGQTNWTTLENLFPAIPIKNEIALGGNQISKFNWLSFYLLSFLGFVLGILSVFFTFFASQLFPHFNYFGYKPPEIMPLFLIGGVALLIQFLIVHNVMVSHLNKKLWGGIGMEAIYTLDSLKGKYGVARKSRKRSLLEKYRSNRWILFQENCERFLKNNGLPVSDAKMNSFTTFGNSFRFPLSIFLYPFQPLIFLYVISQATDVINFLPVRTEQTFKKIDVGKNR